VELNLFGGDEIGGRAFNRDERGFKSQKKTTAAASTKNIHKAILCLGFCRVTYKFAISSLFVVSYLTRIPL
jgi:hypothetical protein